MKGLIQQVIDGDLAPDRADDAADDLLDLFHEGKTPDFREALGLTPEEYKAYAAFAASIATLARWRVEGWPSVCAACHLPIGSDRWAIEADEQGNDVLIHLACTPDRGGGVPIEEESAEDAEGAEGQQPPLDSPFLRRLKRVMPKTPREESNGSG